MKPARHHILTLVALCGALCATSPFAQTGAGLVTERSISTDTALELASASLARCRADGFKVVLSDDGVNPHTIENAYRKAYTAFTTRTGTVEMAKRAQPGLSGFMLLANISPLDGGVPIFAANKELVGAIGISGAPGGDKDTACAMAGLEKIAGKL
jgi:uncharacterized protein GlcG (DUF336 family)